MGYHDDHRHMPQYVPLELPQGPREMNSPLVETCLNALQISLAKDNIRSRVMMAATQSIWYQATEAPCAP